ncbi:MAG: hypothetical protein WCK78_18330 [Paludibacter sp.]
MRIKLTTLLLSLVLICNAQLTLKLRTFNLADVRETSDSIALNAKESFKYSGEGIPIGNLQYYVVNYCNVNDSTNTIKVMFRIDYVGVNQTYENLGTAQYLFYKVTGQFINLFPFWWKFMKKSAIADEVLKAGKDETNVGGATFDFNVESDHWVIEKF